MVLKFLRLALTLMSVASLLACSLPGSTQPVLKIGLVAPFEGWYRARGYDALWAVRLAIQEVNRGGGVAGWQVELVALDDHLDPRWAGQRARELVVDPAVMGVVGHFSPATAQAARTVYTSAALPLITPASVEAQGDGVFVLTPPPDMLARAVLDHLRAQSAVRVALLVGGDGVAWAEVLVEQMEMVVKVEVGTPGWLDRLIAAHPDWVICTLDASTGGELLRRARQAGLSASFIGGPEWGTGALPKVARGMAWDTWFVTGAPRGEDLTGAQVFIRGYHELGEQAPGPDAMLAYDAARALLGALEAIIEAEGYPSREGLRVALERISMTGVTGPIEFNQQGNRQKVSVWVYSVE